MRSLYSLVLLGCAGVAGAQADTTRRDTVRLAPTVVTVTRIPLELSRVPLAVGVTNRDEIQRGKPGFALDEALAGIAGVQVDNRFNYALGGRISIRGFGARAQFGVRGVRVLLDGLPATLPDGQTTLNHVDPAALGRAEVIRGPASALYGNAAGGVIRLTSAPAPWAPLASEHRLLAGGDGLLRVENSLGGRSGGAAYRAWASHLRYAGYREHASARNTVAGASLHLARGRGEARLSFSAVHYDALNPGSLSDSLLRVNRSRAFARNVLDRTGEEGRHLQGGVWWRRELGAGAVELSGYLLGRSLDNPIPGRVIALSRRLGGMRAAWRTGAAGVGWTVGVEGARQRDDRQNFTNAGGNAGTLTLDQLERVTTAAAFTQATAT